MRRLVCTLVLLVVVTPSLGLAQGDGPSRADLLEKLEIRKHRSGHAGLCLSASANREFWIGSCLSTEELDWLESAVGEWLRF